MRVLFVSSGNSNFGITPFIKSQGESLKANGVELNYFTIKGKGLQGYLSNIKPLRNEIKKNNYDIVHSHYIFCGWVSLLAAPKQNHIISFMGSDTYGEFNKKGKRRIKSYFTVILSQLIQPFMKAIIVKSRNLAAYVQNKGKLNIVPNGVDFHKFFCIEKKIAREKLNLDKQKKLILFLSNPLNSRKNYQLLNNAVKGIKSVNYEIIKPYPIKPNLVAFYINACDVLVQPSYQEGSSNLVKEAMACNCPIISTNSGDAVEVIDNTQNCYITEFNPKDLAIKIDKVLEKSERTNGRDKIKHLEINVIAKKIINIYEKIL